MEILPAGSVVFDSVSDEQYEGVVRKPMIRSFTHGRGKEVSEYLVVGRSTGCVSLTTKGSGGTAHTCSGRHSQYSCELLAWIPGVALHGL